MNFEELQQALLEKKKQALYYNEQLDESYADRERYDTRRFKGLIPGLIETVVDKVQKNRTAPQHDAALRNALDHTAGVSQLEAQLAQMQAAQEAAEAAAQREQTAGHAMQVYGPQYGRALANEGVEVPADVREDIYGRNLPESERERFFRPKSGVTVNTGSQPATDPWRNKREELALDQNQGLYTRGDEARRSIPQYDMALNLLESVNTGPLTERINAAKKYGAALGMDVDENAVAQYEMLAPVFGKMTMEKIQDTKGAVSNKEMEMFQRMNANYDYSTEGNKRLLQFAKAQAERDVKVRNMIAEMRRSGAAPMEIAEAVDNYVNENDLSSMLGDIGTGKQQVGGYIIEEVR